MMPAITVQNSRIIELARIEDGADGTISVAEANRQIPFAIKRVYYIYDLLNDSAIRGKHAHKQLEQVLFCVNGGFEMELDDGMNRQTLVMDQPNLGIYLGVDLWHTMQRFSDNCILLVLASDYYSASDYVRDYDEFMRYLKNKR